MMKTMNETEEPRMTDPAFGSISSCPIAARMPANGHPNHSTGNSRNMTEISNTSTTLIQLIWVIKSHFESSVNSRISSTV